MAQGHVRAGADGHWPIVGREAELDFVRRHRETSPHPSVVLSGAPGVGKSRLASEIMEEVGADPGWSTLTIQVASGMDALPFGALRVALDLGAGSGGVSELSEAVVSGLTKAASGRRLMILVDDAHLLDQQSAGLLHASVARGDSAVLATVRSGETTPPAVTALWKDGLAERLEVEAISRLEAIRLLGAVLGSSIEDSTAERIWHASGGNPLYLREIVLASVETGALSELNGEWRWRKGWASASRLQEIVAERLGRLDAEELSLVEAIAVGGRLPTRALVELGPDTALRRLEARGLVTVETGLGGPVVALAHPIHTEVVRSRLPALQVRSICRTLANTMTRVGSSRPSDEIRLALWSLEAGIPVDPVSLRRAADATLWHVGEAIADRIQEILPGVAGRDHPVLVRGPNLGAALRLAEAAWENGGGVPAGAALAITLVWAWDIPRAESVLAQLQLEAHDADDRLRVAVALAHVQFWGRSRYEDAIDTLEKAKAEAPASASKALLSKLMEGRAGIDINIGRPAEAIDQARTAADLLGLDLTAAPAAPNTAASLSMLGRLQEALDFIDAALPPALAGAGHPLGPAQLLLARCSVLARTGRFPEALELAENLRRVAIDVESLDGTAAFGIVAGDVVMLQGRPATAARFYRDAAGLLDERDVLGYRPWALAGLARARAFLGDERGAAEAMAASDGIAGIPRFFTPWLHAARATVRSFEGRPAEAVQILREGIAWSAEAEMVVDEALLLDSLVRLESCEDAVVRLEALCELTDSPLVVTLAGHARALLARDPVGLLEAAEAFARSAGWLVAAAAAGAAAGIFADRHRERESSAAARRALGWYSHCEGARSPLLDRLVAPSTLTSRELEVARLAAMGQSSKDIAERLVVSIRTVDAHLYRAYAKLGVHQRGELAAVLGIESEKTR